MSKIYCEYFVSIINFLYYCKAGTDIIRVICSIIIIKMEQVFNYSVLI